MDAEKSIAEPSSPAQFDITIENEGAVNHSYRLSVLSPKSSWIYYPSNVRVPAGENRSIPLTVSPVNDSLQQRYSFDLTIGEVSSGEIQEITGFFNVKQPYSVQITGLEKSGEEFYPGEVFETSITIKNLENELLRDYSVESAYGNKTRSETGTPILPGGQRRYSFRFRVGEDAVPGERKLIYTVRAGDEQRRFTQNIRVRKVENLSINSTRQNSILSNTVRKSISNTGNSPSNASLTAEVPSYLAPITETSPQAEEEKVDGRTIYTWKQDLGPSESFSASYTVKYWIPALGIVLLLAGLVAIKKIGTAVSIEKTVEEHDGEIKVMLEIENKGERTLEGLELEEFIPDIATVEERFEMNAPRIRETSEGTKLNWEVDLEPGDQRVIQYRIKPRVEVEEEVELQKTVLKDSRGQKIAESNQTSVEFRPSTT